MQARAFPPGEHPLDHVQHGTLGVERPQAVVPDQHGGQLGVLPHRGAALTILGRLARVDGRRGLPPRDRTEVPFDQREGRRRHDVAREHERRVVRRVAGCEVGPRVVERDAVQVGHETDRVPAPWALHEGLQVERFVHHPGHLVVDAEAPLLLHDTSLLLEVLRCDGEVRHAVALEVEDQREGLTREVVEVGGEITAGVPVGRATVPLDQVVEDAGTELLPAVEHHVLEEMRDAGPPLPLVPGAAVVEDVRGNDRRRVVLLDEHEKPVLERAVRDRQVNRCSVRGCVARARRAGHNREHGEEKHDRRTQHGAPSLADDGGSSSW